MKLLMIIFMTFSVEAALAECSLKESNVNLPGATFNEFDMLIKKSTVSDSDYEIDIATTKFAYDKKNKCWRAGGQGGGVGDWWNPGCIAKLMDKNGMKHEFPLVKIKDKSKPAKLSGVFSFDDKTGKAVLYSIKEDDAHREMDINKPSLVFQQRTERSDEIYSVQSFEKGQQLGEYVFNKGDSSSTGGTKKDKCNVDLRGHSYQTNACGPCAVAKPYDASASGPAGAGSAPAEGEH